MNDLLARLRKQFESQYEEQSNGCWLWTGPTNGAAGYGQMKVFGGIAPAHRVAYELYVGAIPEGLVIDHLCHTRLCVNYEHLEPVTFQENILRGEGLAAKNARKTHCLREHEFTKENTYIDKRGSRYCRKCVNIRARKNQAAVRRAAGVPEREFAIARS